jgi:hypothetical protein
MPLLDIVRMTSINQTFYIGFAFLSDEKEPIYKFVMENLKSIYQQLNISILAVVLTDKETTLINAIEDVFPLSETATLICRWHVNRNI